jgi:hypothetical protein
MYQDGPDMVGVSVGRGVSVGGTSVGVIVIVGVEVGIFVAVNVAVGVIVGVAVGLGFNGLLGPSIHTTITAAPTITIITVINSSREELRGPCLFLRYDSITCCADPLSLIVLVPCQIRIGYPEFA